MKRSSKFFRSAYQTPTTVPVGAVAPHLMHQGKYKNSKNTSVATISSRPDHYRPNPPPLGRRAHCICIRTNRRARSLPTGECFANHAMDKTDSLSFRFLGIGSWHRTRRDPLCTRFLAGVNTVGSSWRKSNPGDRCLSDWLAPPPSCYRVCVWCARRSWQDFSSTRDTE